MERISPTRTELLTRRAQIRLATQGAQLLRGKREALVREFIAGVHMLTGLRRELRSVVTEATGSLARSLSIDGAQALASAALACRRTVHVNVEEGNIWGTKIATVKTDFQVRSRIERGFCPSTGSARIDETTDRFERVVELVLSLAPLERKMRVLADEIRKTSRRVNALEQRLLPRLSEEVRYIRGALDQREREDIFRLKHIKRIRPPDPPATAQVR